MEKIPYLKELGVNAVELMPVFEFDEMRDARLIDDRQLFDYWGYNPVSFFAPNTSYASKKEYNLSLIHIYFAVPGRFSWRISAPDGSQHDSESRN